VDSISRVDGQLCGWVKQGVDCCVGWRAGWAEWVVLKCDVRCMMGGDGGGCLLLMSVTLAA
jgi:hypothetical protein